MTAMQENASLTDSVNILRTQLEQLEQVKSDETVKLEGVIEEFTERLGKMEGQLRVVQRERDALKGSEERLRGEVEEGRRVLEGKEEMVRGLMSEGEKLSKTEMKHLQTIKKQRAKEADMEKELKELRDKVQAMTGEIADLKERVGKLAEIEKKQADTVRSLTEVNEQQAKLVVKLEGDVTSGKGKQAELQASLDRAWSDLAEARKMHAEASSAAAAAGLEEKVKANEELRRQLEKVKEDGEAVESGLRKEILDLRTSLTRVEDEAGWKEDNLRREISTLQQRLRTAEARNDDLMSVAQDSTRPYLRQIELLQTQHGNAVKSWEGIERDLTLKLHDAETDRANAVVRERALGEKVNGLLTRISALESEVAQERQERARMEMELETEKHRATEFERTAGDLSVKLEHVRGVHAKALEEAKQTYQRMLRQQIQEERDQWEDRMKAEEKARMAKEVEKQKLRLDIGQRRGSGFGMGRRDSSASNDGLSSGMRTPSLTDVSSPGPGSSFGGGGGSAGGGLTTAAIIERLHSSVKQYEGQVSSLQTQLQMASQTRDELAEELVRVTNENETMKSVINKLQESEQGKADLERRYNGALELLGEKTEQVEEMQADINDMKQAFRAQVQELLAEVEELKNRVK
ncbi:TATA element modulatory factor 1 [Rhizophlyctis rosea]|uniref:TATA element modulatory factor 1 n=1 Tax=Rhizophlyctis rosea TaxID=64517 RepID=A0AAD5X1P8_9FUNG|nr:TATA element modulatory factor 1 [Rhizophlyctis rosea]